MSQPREDKETHSTMRDFVIQAKLGSHSKFHFYIGSGSFSDVFRVKRISDGIEYALKKVSLLSNFNVMRHLTYELKNASIKISFYLYPKNSFRIPMPHIWGY